MDIKRKLASIRMIGELMPIDKADNLELAMIDGWQVVVQKGIHKVGDLVVYFEIDSFLPMDPMYAWMKDRCYKNHPELGEGYRVKTIKLRGSLSQGIVIPLNEFPPEIVSISFDSSTNDNDLTAKLNVKLWEPPAARQTGSSNKAKGNFPFFIRKTDQERVQNVYKDLTDQLDHLFEVTIKLDGSSMTIYRYNDMIGVCSRNFDLKLEDNDRSFFVQVANDSGLLTILQNYCTNKNRNYALQGELMGPGVQGNRENLESRRFFLFDIFDIDTQRYLSSQDRLSVATELKMMGANYEHVPILQDVDEHNVATIHFPLRKFIKSDTPKLMVADLLEFAEQSSLTPEIDAEGVVFKRQDGSFSFKAISNKYLLNEK